MNILPNILAEPGTPPQVSLMASRRRTLAGALWTRTAKEAPLHSGELGSDRYDASPRFSEDVTTG